MTNIPSDLAKLGFAVPSLDERRRLLVGSQGLDKTGKTEFGLTAPGPIGILSLDIGMEGVVEKWVKRGKKIWLLEYNIPPITKEGKPLAQSDYISYWNKTRVAYESLISHKDVRTVMVDTGSEWWELAKLAEFGTVAPRVDVKSRYMPLNQLFRSLIRRAYDSDKNLIITHKMKEKYTSKSTTKSDGSTQTTDSWDGQSYKRSGFAEEGYLIQINIEHFYQNGEFGIRIINCRQDMSLSGFELGKKECTFANLGVCIHPETTEADWK